MPFSSRFTILRTFFLLAYLSIVGAMGFFWPFVEPDDGTAWTYLAASTLGYAAIYLLPVLLLTLLLEFVLPGKAEPPPWR